MLSSKPYSSLSDYKHLLLNPRQQKLFQGTDNNTDLLQAGGGSLAQRSWLGPLVTLRLARKRQEGETENERAREESRTSQQKLLSGIIWVVP